MDASKLSDRTRLQLEKLPPEKHTKAEAIIRRIQTPEYRAREHAVQSVLDREYRETGRIAMASQKDQEDPGDAGVQEIGSEGPSWKGEAPAEPAPRLGRSLALPNPTVSKCEAKARPKPNAIVQTYFARATRVPMNRTYSEPSRFFPPYRLTRHTWADRDPTAPFRPASFTDCPDILHRTLIRLHLPIDRTYFARRPTRPRSTTDEPDILRA
jgi:hypothetical protein